MLKGAFLTILLCISSSLFAADCRLMDNFSFEQKHVVYKTFNRAKEYDLGYTMSAIVIRESSAGKYPINIDGDAFGAFHVNVHYAISRVKDVLGYEWDNNTFNKNRLATILVRDYDIAFRFAKDNFERWLKRRGNNWRDAWASYYSGKYYKGSAGQDYASEIATLISQLKQCDLEKPHHV